jgi:hypothetical protein
MNHLRYVLQNSSHARNRAILQRKTHPTIIISTPSTSKQPILHKSFSKQPDTQSTYSLHPQKTSNCPKCGQVLPTRLPTCTNPNCGYIGPIPTDLRRDYFGLFGLSGVAGRPGSSNGENGDGIGSRNAFSVDPKLLRRRFLQMQKVCHPDVWAKRGPVS